MNARLVFALAVLAAWPALAQTRQPAQITTLPTTSPQEFDLLDNTGKWMPLGAASGAAGTDVRAFGCVADGVTDQTACINNALANAPDCVRIPATPLGFYVAGTITVTRCMRGTVFTPSNTTLNLSGTSRILCNNQVAQPCVVVDRQAQLSAQIENITLLGSGATPAAGSIGFQWKTGYNLILTNFQSANFDTCAKFGPIVGGGMGPISTKMTNTFFSRCQKHYVVNDGVPELYFIGGRWGGDGLSDYPADDFLYATKTVNSGGGDGPNGIVLDSMQLNTQVVGCPFRWGGFIASPTGVFNANKIVNTHVEILDTGYTGSATQGMICVDGTVPYFPAMQVADSWLVTDGGAVNHPTFLVAPGVKWNGGTSFFTSNRLLGAPFTLTIANQAGNQGPIFIGNYMQAGSSFVAGDNTAQLTLTNNFLGGDTISGQWNNLNLTGNFGVLVDSATGVVHQTNGAAIGTWTPVLSFSGGGSATYTSNGTWFRTQEGGLLAYFTVTFSALSSPVGFITITGYPKVCAGHVDSALLTNATNFTGLTGTPYAIWLTGTSNINLAQTTATGLTNIAGANLTATTSFTGTVTCGVAQ